MRIIAVIKYALGPSAQQRWSRSCQGRDGPRGEWSREHGAGRAPSQPHAMQGNWLPQVSGCGAPAGWHRPWARRCCGGLAGRDLCVQWWFLSERCSSGSPGQGVWCPLTSACPCLSLPVCLLSLSSLISSSAFPPSPQPHIPTALQSRADSPEHPLLPWNPLPYVSYHPFPTFLLPRGCFAPGKLLGLALGLR